MVTIGLCVIVKDRAEELRRMLDSVAPAKLDEIILCDTGSKDDSIERVAKDYGAKYLKHADPNPDFVREHGHISDFAAARNASFAVCTSDWLLWLDSDDVLCGADNLRKIVSIADSRGLNNLLVRYDYAKDERGNLITVQWRERILRNGLGFRWVAPVHEVCLDSPEHPFRSAQAKPEELRVEHRSQDVAQGGWKDERNLRILEFHLEKGGSLDPRMWKKLGMARRGLRQWAKAIEAYENHIKSSNWDDDVYLSQTEMAECYIGLGDIPKAMGILKEAMFNKPQYPQAYIGAAVCENRLHNPDRAILWCEKAKACTATTEGIGFNPSGCKSTLYSTLYDAYKAKGDPRRALEALKEAESVYPDRQLLARAFEETAAEVRARDTYGAFLRVLNETLEDNDPSKVEALLAGSPRIIRGFPELLPLKRKQPPKDRPTMAILCPQVEPPFGPGSQDSGIGGSEEAVIFLSRELARLGFYVDVFVGSPVFEGERDGVNWYPYGAFRHGDFYDTVVVWRYVQMAEKPFNARNVVAWLHDLPHRALYTPAVMANIQKFIFLSKFHRRQYPWIPDDRVIYSRNGLADDYLAEPRNDPKRVIFTSNPTRGLLRVLQMWPDVYSATGAELHTYYGVTKVTQMAANQQPLLAEELAKIDALMKQPGVVPHGMIGQKELAEENAKAGVWFYPTSFPEISCISAMRAQAHGAIPVCASLGALSETVQHGYKIGGDPDFDCMQNPEYQELAKNMLISLIRNPQDQERIRREMIPWARRAFSWAGVADQWKDLFEGSRCSQGRPKTLEQILRSLTEEERLTSAMT